MSPINFYQARSILWMVRSVRNSMYLVDLVSVRMTRVKVGTGPWPVIAKVAPPGMTETLMRRILP